MEAGDERFRGADGGGDGLLEVTLLGGFAEVEGPGEEGIFVSCWKRGSGG